MAGERPVAIRRAVASLGVSLALHLALGMVVGLCLLGSLLVDRARDPGPVALEIVAADDGPGQRAAPAVPDARPPAMAAAAVVLPPVVPLAGEETPMAAAPVALTAPNDVAPLAGAPAPDLVTASDEAVASPDDPVSPARLDEGTRSLSISASAVGEPFVGRREVLEFLLDHLEFTAHVMRALRPGRHRSWRIEDGRVVGDGWGATGRVSVAQAGSGTRVIHVTGEVRSTLLPPIPGEIVVTVSYDAEPTGTGRDRLVAAVSSQLTIGGLPGDSIARLAGTAATAAAGKESRRMLRDLARVVQEADEKPDALLAALGRSPDVPHPELEQFRVLLSRP